VICNFIFLCSSPIPFFYGNLIFASAFGQSRGLSEAQTPFSPARSATKAVNIITQLGCQSRQKLNFLFLVAPRFYAFDLELNIQAQFMTTAEPLFLVCARLKPHARYTSVDIKAEAKIIKVENKVLRTINVKRFAYSLRDVKLPLLVRPSRRKRFFHSQKAAEHTKNAFRKRAAAEALLPNTQRLTH
jgi:hypothetical protein